jgi:hypothetical protein
MSNQHELLKKKMERSMTTRKEIRELIANLIRLTKQDEVKWGDAYDSYIHDAISEIMLSTWKWSASLSHARTVELTVVFLFGVPLFYILSGGKSDTHITCGCIMLRPLYLAIRKNVIRQRIRKKEQIVQGLLDKSKKETTEQ